MRTIFKYPVRVTDTFTISMPVDAEILQVGSQRGLSYLWVFINDTNAPTAERTFYVYGTGNSINEARHRLVYIGTWMEDSFVWHLFEEME